MVHIVSGPNTGASMFSSSLHKSFLEAALAGMRFSSLVGNVLMGSHSLMKGA